MVPFLNDPSLFPLPSTHQERDKNDHNCVNLSPRGKVPLGTRILVLPPAAWESQRKFSSLESIISIAEGRGMSASFRDIYAPDRRGMATMWWVQWLGLDGLSYLATSVTKKYSTWND